MRSKSIFRKSFVTTAEQVSLIFSILALTVLLVFLTYLQTLYDPVLSLMGGEAQKVTFTRYDAMSRSLSPPEAGYVLFLVLSLLLGPVVLAFKRVALSRCLLFITLILGILVVPERITHFLSIPPEGRAEAFKHNIFFPFTLSQVSSYAVILFLFLWHTRILRRDKLRQNILND